MYKERPGLSRAAELKRRYVDFLGKAAGLFPNVDQRLLLNMLQFQTLHDDWDGDVLLKISYPLGSNMEKKKEWIYGKYHRIPSIERNKVVRFKALRIFIEDLEELLNEDPEIESITGSTPAPPPSDQFSV
ncbi:MAG: hypothetical protein MN733_34985 [Nitrososphaera sp.]|nr:hypothetical protein [Nitrososphaera sp.]